MIAATIGVIVVIIVVTLIKVYKIVNEGELNMNQRGTPRGNSGNHPLAVTPGAANAQVGPTDVTSIEETGEMVYLANSSWAGDREYHFNYKWCGSTWRAYILRMPDLGVRSSGSVETHRIFGSDGTYICWDRSVDSLEGMQAISRQWADCIQKYINTGERFG